MRKSSFENLVKRALRRIPKPFREAMDNCEIVIQDRPDRRLMEEIFGDPDAEAYGLFVGVPLPERHAGDWGQLPSLIHIYRGPLMEDFPDPEELTRQVEITLVHEVAHLMGFDEEILEEYGYG